MQSFTWGSDEGMQALIEKHHVEFTNGIKLDERWSLAPNPSDFKTLIDSLRYVADLNESDLGEAAADVLSSIAESLGIEFI